MSRAELGPQSVLQAIWETSKVEVLGRVDVVAGAVTDALTGSLCEQTRVQAAREAHKLAGSVRMLGFAVASDHARALEHALAVPDGPPAGELPRLAELVSALRHELENDRDAGPADAASPPLDGRPALLLVDEDPQRAQRLLVAAGTRGVRAVVAADLDGARRLIAQDAPEIVVLDLSLGVDADATMAFLAEASAQRPVMVVAGADPEVDRVEVAKCGGRGFLARSLEPAETIAAALELRERVRVHGTRILAVDDDPVVLSVLQSVLGIADLEVQICEHPGAFWERLDEVRPDLVLLDFDMPEISGADLCRALRNEARWAGLPVIFLTARTDAESVQEIFDSGADDYLSKPFVGPEVVARIANRLERVRLYRALADTDSLTGLPNRRSSTAALETLLRMADRQRQPAALAILDVDRFKSINDAHGHAGGDALLHELGAVIRRFFRGEDVVARWGGDELVVGMYGMVDADSRQRLGDFVEEVRERRFLDARIAVTLSVGVAQYPTDGADVEELYRAADAALYVAKAEGRDRVVPAGRDPRDGPAMVDVAIVEDDALLGRLLEHALQTRGYRTRLITDGVAAAAELASQTPQLLAPLLLLDWDLPGLDGLRVLHALRERGVLERMTVIMLTARGAEDEVLEALEAGAVDHVTKPFSVPVLMQRVRRAMDR